MLEIRLLGTLEVARDGRPVELTGTRQRAALVLLALEANRVVSSDRLVDALWGEQPPPTAATSLRNCVSQLRKQLGSDAIETRAPGYVLRVAEEGIDLARFDRLLAASREAPVGDRLRLLQKALVEWRGPPLPDLRYEPSLEREIARLEDVHVAAREDLFDAELEAGAHGPLVPVLEGLVARHPHRERLRGQLMVALYRSGRQAEALQAYQDARRSLADDLGLEPGPALRRLHGAILRQEALVDAQTTADVAPSREHLSNVADAILAGRLVAVLAPTTDLAPQLAARFRYPAGDVLETPRVAQYAAVLRGHGPLHDELRTLSAGEPTAVHRFFASLPSLLRERGLPQQLLVTADYDGALERAFVEAGEEFDTVAYLAAGPNRGRFCHVSADGVGRVIESPSEYANELALDRRTVILRVRGRVDETVSREWESLVVTEDDHLDYARRADVAGGIPIGLAATLRRSHFLFLGYAVRDWCLRVVLSRICTETPLAYRSWAVSPESRATEAELWQSLGVDFVRSPLEPYLEGLTGALDAGAGVHA